MFNKSKQNKRNKLFNEMAIAFNNLDIDTVERFYYDMVRFIVNETKKRGKLVLPDLGVFKIIHYKRRMNWDPVLGKRKLVDESIGLSFNVDYKIRYYLNNKEYD